MTQLFNKSAQLLKRKILRQRMSDAERYLWRLLRDRRFFDACPKARLVIEVDGRYHQSKEMRLYDTARQEFLESLGLKVLRFRNEKIYTNIQSVLHRIQENIAPSPLEGEGEGVR